MNQKPELNELEKLNQLSKKELVKMILTQQEIIEELKKEIEKLKISRSLDSKISSKPPSSDLLKKPERKEKSSSQKPPKSPGGQLGHQGKTRKGFGRVDRWEILKAETCSSWRENSHQQQDLDSALQLKTQINLTLSKWSKKAGYEAGKLLRNLKLKADQWWYFLDHPEITPDNNLAERALRLAVTKRKVSGGSRSMARFEDTANLLSVIQS